MFLDESTVATTSTPDQIELRTDVSAPSLVESVNRWRRQKNQNWAASGPRAAGCRPL